MSKYNIETDLHELRFGNRSNTRYNIEIDLNELNCLKNQLKLLDDDQSDDVKYRRILNDKIKKKDQYITDTILRSARNEKYKPEQIDCYLKRHPAFDHVTVVDLSTINGKPVQLDYMISYGDKQVAAETKHTMMILDTLYHNPVYVARIIDTAKYFRSINTPYELLVYRPVSCSLWIKYLDKYSISLAEWDDFFEKIKYRVVAKYIKIPNELYTLTPNHRNIKEQAKLMDIRCQTLKNLADKHIG